MYDVSAALKKLRVEKGLSLEEMQKKTKIHINILKAIEGDSLTNLSPIYLKGFIKIYCNALGVDSKDYISDAKESKPAAVKAASQTELKSAPAPKMKLGSWRPSKQLKQKLVLIAVAVLALFVLIKIGKFISLKIAQRPQKIAVAPAVKETKKTDKLQKIKLASEIMLLIKAKENCMVTVKADGKTLFSRVLEKGRGDSWKAKERIEVSLGNAGVVELEVNGQRFPSLGRKGQSLKNIVITKEGLKVGK